MKIVPFHNNKNRNHNNNNCNNNNNSSSNNNNNCNNCNNNNQDMLAVSFRRWLRDQQRRHPEEDGQENRQNFRQPVGPEDRENFHPPQPAKIGIPAGTVAQLVASKESRLVTVETGGGSKKSAKKKSHNTAESYFYRVRRSSALSDDDSHEWVIQIDRAYVDMWLGLLDVAGGWLDALGPTGEDKAVTPCRLWAINRQTFQAIMVRTGLAKHAQAVRFLHSIALFSQLDEAQVSRLADLLEEKTYKYGQCIVRQGVAGCTFYIVTKGDLRVTVATTTNGARQPTQRVIRTLGVGDYFGENCLKIGDGPEVHAANIVVSSPEGARCLTLNRDSYAKLIETDGQMVIGGPADSADTTSTASHESESRQQLAAVELAQLRVIATLGKGGFGRVELVQHAGRPDLSYALKIMKKEHIVETKQEVHTLNERDIMLQCRCRFIVSLYRTYRDPKCLYMLMEACLGGEIWSLLRDRGYFDDTEARFYAANVMGALEYLHSKGILYRDLKPENVLLTADGYAKLVDFGFAKKIGLGKKTWTFCGTPEYVAPEIVLNKGHDIAVDYWSLGIFIYELLTGSPPWSSSDTMRTYNLILKGIDAVEFPARIMSQSGIRLIKRLCRDQPMERLGCEGRGGMRHVRADQWFEGFDFDACHAGTMPPPFPVAITSQTDVSHFDNFGPDDDPPPADDLSGWDENF